MTNMTEINKEYNAKSDVKDTESKTQVKSLRKNNKPMLNCNGDITHIPKDKSVVDYGCSNGCHSEVGFVCDCFNDDGITDHDCWMRFVTFFRVYYRSILTEMSVVINMDDYIPLIENLYNTDSEKMVTLFEYVVEDCILQAKQRQLDLINNVHSYRGSKIFVFNLIDGYHRLVFAACKLHPIFDFLGLKSFSKFKLSWRHYNEHLYYKHVYSEPEIQDVLPYCVSKLGQMNEAPEFNRRIIRQFFKFCETIEIVNHKYRILDEQFLDGLDTGNIKNWVRIKTQLKQLPSDVLNFTNKMLSSDCMNGSLTNSGDSKKCNADSSNKVSPKVNANVDVAKTITESAISGSNRKNIVADKMTNNNEVDKSSRVMDKRKRSSSEHIRELYNNDDHNYGQCAAHNNHCAGDAVSIDEYHFCICQIKNSFNDFSKEDLIKAGAAMQKNGICDCCQVKSAKIPSPENLNSPNSTTNNRKPKKEIPTTPTPHLNEELLNHLQKESTLLHCTVPSHGHRTTKPRLGNIRKCCNAGCPNPPVVGLSTLHVHKKQTSKENSCKNTCNGEKSHKEPRPPTPIPVPPTNNGNQSQSSTKSGQNGKTQQKVAQTRQPASQAPPKRCQHPKPHSKRNSKCLQPGDNVTVCSKHAEVGTKMMISHQHEHVACTEHSGGDESGSDVSSPQRHCDCCYCEVFGHGGPQAAPVSRNYQEMRERLRTLLSKKKEQKTEKHEQQQQTEWSADDFKMKFDDSDSDDFENFLQKKMRGENYQGDKPLQEILNFIEGTKGRNQKRAAKQARRKQRQVEEEERRRKEAEEAEQRKLQEKKRKEEEERRKEEQQKRKQEQARKLQEQKRKLEEEKRKQQLQLAKEQNSKSKKKKGNQQSLILSEIKMATAATNTIISSNSSSSSSTSKKKRRQTSFDISADATKCQQLNTDTSLSNGAKNGKSQKAKDRQSGKKSTSAEQEIVADSTKQKSVDKSQKKKSVSETFDVEQQSSSSSPQKQNRKKSAKQQLNGVVKEQRENKSQQQSNSVAAKKQQQNATKQQNTAGKQHNNGSGNDGKQQSLSKQQNSSSKPKQQQQNDSWNQAKQHAIPKQQALQPHNKQQQQQQQQRPKSQQATNAAKQQQQQDGSSKRQQNLAKQQFVNSQKQHQQQTNASKYHQQQQQNGAKQQQQRNINSQSVSVSAQSKKQQQQSSSCNGNSNNLFKQQQHKVQQSSPSQPMYESRHLQTICKNEMERTKQENSSDKMVTIKRVIEPDTTDTKVTITLRGNTPNEDKILYTLQNGQLCNTKKKNNKIGPPPPMLPLPPPPISSLHPVQRDISSMINTKSQQQPFVTNNATLDKITERLATLNLGPEITAERITKPPIMSTSSTSSTTELTTPTAIQINQAVNQISSRSRNNDFNFEDIKLPPGITITKVDPEKVQERKQIQQAKQHSQQQQFQQQIQSQPPIRQAIVTPTVSPSNVIVVGTDERDSYYNSNNNHSATEAGGKKKRRRRRKDTNNANMELNHSAGAEVNIHPVPPSSGIGNGALPLNMSNGFGSAYMNSGPPTAPTTTPPGFSTANSLFSSPSTDYRSSAPPAIIQMNGSMVTIRNPLMHQPFFGRSYEYHDGLNSRMGAGGGGSPIGNGNSGSAVGSGDTYKDDFVYSKSDDDVEPDDVEPDDYDEYEREIEQFKIFCSQSVPAKFKPKVNLNLENIMLKKKTAAVIGCS